MDQIQTVILAAGSSKRLGFNKLCVKVDGQAVIRKTVELFMGYSDRVIVVTGFERERIEQELHGLPIVPVHNPDHLEGMSSSVRAALPWITGYEGAFFHLGDKPFVTPRTLERTIESFRRGNRIVLPLFRGMKGHPVLIRGRLYIEEMASLEGDMGLRRLVERHSDEIATVEGDEGAILDIDSEEDIAQLVRRGFAIEKS